MKPIVWTAHAEQAIASRKISKNWVEDAIRQPHWQEKDPSNSNRFRYYRKIPEWGHRVIRVVCEDNNGMDLVVITVFPDRKAANKGKTP